MTTLRHSETNPAPDVYADGLIETPDRFSIRYALFRTAVRPFKGTIVLLQGRNEQIEKYFETAADFGRLGFDVATFDWRGQGGSQRFYTRNDAGYVDSFDQYAIDLETFFEQVVLPDCRPPYFIVAHSMGWLVALYSAPSMVNRVRRMVLAAPFLGLPTSPFKQSLSRVATRTMCFLGLGNFYVTGGSAERMRKPFETNRLTTDAHRYARNISIAIRFPELALGGGSAAWTTAVFDAFDRVTDPVHMARTTIPMLLFMAGDERIVSNAAIVSLAANLRSASLLTIDGSRHEMMQEADVYREQFFAALTAFIPGTGD